MSLPVIEYLTDAAQRTVLFWDVMRNAAINTASISPRPRPTCSIMRSN